MRSLVAKIGESKDELAPQLPLHIEIPLLHVRAGESRIHIHDRHGKKERLGRALLRCRSPHIGFEKLELLGIGAVRIGELNVVSGQSVGERLRSRVGVQRDELYGIGEYSVAAANTGLAITERIVGESEARRETIPTSRDDSKTVDAFVARKQVAERRQRIDTGLLAGAERGILAGFILHRNG